MTLARAAGVTAAGRAGPGPEVSVVLPCLDEEASVGLCVTEAVEAMRAAGIRGEVLVVDNGCTDASVEVAREAGARVVAEGRPGYGSAVAAGVRAALAPVVVMADADLTYDLARIPELVRPVVDGEADLVMGSRLEAANRHTMPVLHRLVGTPAITFLIARACGGRVAVRDSQSGYRAFRRDAVLGLDLQSTGMEYASEMLIRATQAGLRVRELPTGYRRRLGVSKLDTVADGRRHLQLILELAPDLLLVTPGTGLLGVGVLLTLVGLFSPSGITLGSLRWQPVFFSTIALVLGTQMLLAGSVLAHRLSLMSPSVCRRFGFVGGRRFAPGCVASGVALLAAGLAVDLVLFVRWTAGAAPLASGLALAALAQSLLIVGGSVATFGVVSAVLLGRTAKRVRPSAARAPAVVEPQAGAVLEAPGEAGDPAVPLLPSTGTP